MSDKYVLLGDEYLSEDIWSTVEIKTGSKEECTTALERMRGPWGDFANGQYMNCKVVKQKDAMKHMRTYEW